MLLEELRDICLSFPGVTEDIKWETRLCFSVGGKMFIITSLDEIPVSASFKTSSEIFAQLIERDGFKPAPYLGRNQWVFVDNTTNLSVQEWKTLIKEAYNIIFQKLPKKTREEISAKSL